MNSQNIADSAGVYCFTLDDNIRFLEECTRAECRDLFQAKTSVFRRNATAG